MTPTKVSFLRQITDAGNRGGTRKRRYAKPARVAPLAMRTRSGGPTRERRRLWRARSGRAMTTSVVF